ncbi:MAG: metallophosphoesterase [Myxococcota bacterium]|nr:metallophosphoesterase [Myxococcota bacterium]
MSFARSGPAHAALLLAILGGCSSADPGGSEAPACPDESAATGALVLDGVDDHAKTSLQPALGLATFTLEAWVRRDGDGTTMTSGAGGLNLVPIMTKGLGEGDGSNVDCNYAFGFWGDVIGADFEDLTSGANHPVVGRTAIPRGTWHHVAATYDGASWRLYVDGVLDGEAQVSATPRTDSIHPFAIGTAISSEGVARGFLHGAVDEVRLWDRARTAAEISESMHRTIAMSEGLVGRWSLDRGAADPTIAADSAGSAPLTLVGASVAAAHVPLDGGGPPVVAAITPFDGALSGPDVVLELSLEMAARAPVDVTYHVRELGEADDFTIVVMPDTQYYTVEGRNLERYFHDQTTWIRAQRADYNIIGVIHNGDLINNEPQIYQWQVADAAMARLETPEPSLEDGMPYGIAVGNHDNKLTGLNTALDTVKFNTYFGVSRFAGRSYYGGHHGTKNDNSWVTFSAGGLDFVVVNLMYDLDQDPAVLAWARSIFAMHPDAFGILNTHYLLTGAGNFSAQSRLIYAALRDVPNVHLMTGGHVATENRRIDTFAGHTIHSMLADYQGRADGGQGYLRLWEFSPANGTVSVRTYSPTLDKWETDADSEFTIDVDLRGAGGPFREVALAGVAPEAVAATLSDLEIGKTYEWYADVETCGHHVRTPLYRFTTIASAAAARQINHTFYQPPRRQPAPQVTDGPVHVRPDDPTLAD